MLVKLFIESARYFDSNFEKYRYFDHNIPLFNLH